MDVPWAELWQRVAAALDHVPGAIAVLADSLTVVASGLAIYIFFTQRKSLRTVFRLLLGYAHQLTLSELKGKLDKLNELRVADPQQLEEIVAVVAEITGQTRGNPQLRPLLDEPIRRVNKLVDTNKLTEPTKRNFVAELRERLRHLDVESFNKLSGEGK